MVDFLVVVGVCVSGLLILQWMETYGRSEMQRDVRRLLRKQRKEAMKGNYITFRQSGWY